MKLHNEYQRAPQCLCTRRLRKPYQVVKHLGVNLLLLLRFPPSTHMHFSAVTTRENQVPVIADMASQCRKEVVQNNSMVALVNITCINGQEVGRQYFRFKPGVVRNSGMFQRVQGKLRGDSSV